MNYYTTLLVCGSLILNVSCKKEEIQMNEPVQQPNPVLTPEDPTPDHTTGFEGQVAMYSDDGKPISRGNCDITLSSQSGTFTTQTDELGKFSFNNILEGPCYLTFSKQGFGTFRVNNLYNVEGNAHPENLKQIHLSKLSTTEIRSLKVRWKEDVANFNVGVNFNERNGTNRYYRIFFGNNGNVSSDEYQGFSNLMVAKADVSSCQIKLSSLESWGFKQGDHVYAKIYGDSYYSNEYEDLISKKMVFPNLNAVTVNYVEFLIQ